MSWRSRSWMAMQRSSVGIASRADGTSETLTDSGDKVNTSTMTTIANNELYDIGGKAPARASVEFVFSDALSVEPETATGTR